MEHLLWQEYGLTPAQLFPYQWHLDPGAKALVVALGRTATWRIHREGDQFILYHRSYRKLAGSGEFHRQADAPPAPAVHALLAYIRQHDTGKGPRQWRHHRAWRYHHS